MRIWQREIPDQLEFQLFYCEIAHRKQIEFQKNSGKNIKCVHTSAKFFLLPEKMPTSVNRALVGVFTPDVGRDMKATCLLCVTKKKKK